MSAVRWSHRPSLHRQAHNARSTMVMSALCQRHPHPVTCADCFFFFLRLGLGLLGAGALYRLVARSGTGVKRGELEFTVGCFLRQGGGVAIVFGFGVGVGADCGMACDVGRGSGCAETACAIFFVALRRYPGTVAVARHCGQTTTP